MKRKAFTLVEVVVVMSLMCFILVFAYKIFFAEKKVVNRSIDSIRVNEGFRRVLAFMGDDIKEANNILEPLPIMLNEVSNLKTKTGVILITESSEINPRIRFDSPLGGQVGLKRTVKYTLEETKDKESDGAPSYKLLRYETVEESNGSKNTQRQALATNIRDFIVYRTVKEPYKADNIKTIKDRIIRPRPTHESGTGNSLIHIKMVLERERDSNDKGSVYNITMETSFYKRGKEIFLNP